MPSNLTRTLFFAFALASSSVPIAADAQTAKEQKTVQDGMAKLNTGQNKKAIASLTPLLAKRAKWKREWSVTLLSTLSAAHLREGDASTAIEMADNAVKEATKKPADARGAMLGLHMLAQAHTSKGNFPAAIKALEQARALGKSSKRKDLDRAGTLELLARVHLLSGDAKSALAPAEEAYNLQKARFGDAHMTTITTLNTLGQCQVAAGRKEEGKKTLERSYEGMKKSEAPAKRMADVEASLGRLYLDLDQLEKAGEFVQLAHEKRVKLYGKTHPLVGHSLNDLASVALKEKKFKIAEMRFQEAIKVYRAVYKHHVDIALAHENLAAVFITQREPQKAAIQLAAAADEYDRTAPKSPARARALKNLKTLYTNLGETEKAAAVGRRMKR